ncbi:MAG: type I methionyl aminopeptidase [Planctomycetota bacterium]|nr:type I methionyl aminopeptidase [Planctomycetota bacterium]
MAQKLYSERQMALIREAGRVVAQALELIRKAVAPGVTTRQVERVAAEHIARCGGRSPFLGYQFPGKAPFPAVVCTSVNDVVVHGVPDDAPLEEGDLLSIDIGCIKDGYVGDAAWTFCVGEPDERAKRLMAAGEEALYAGIKAMRARGKLGEISRAIQTLVEGRGFTVVRDYVGHGVGQALHEEPQVPNYVSAGALLPIIGKTLQPGMVLAVEPMVNEGGAAVVSVAGQWPVRTSDGGRSVHFEHTVAVLPDRTEVLTLP